MDQLHANSSLLKAVIHTILADLIDMKPNAYNLRPLCHVILYCNVG